MAIERPPECCDNCERETGNAGAGDGSLFDVLGQGPYCQGCYDLLVGDVERELKTFSCGWSDEERRHEAECLNRPARCVACERYRLRNIVAELTEGPDDAEQRIHQTGGYQTGLHCGVEDRDLQRDAYGAADYGFTEGVDAVIEWVNGVVATPEVAQTAAEAGYA